MASNQEEEVLGKAYDGRLMRRLLTYLRPYKWHVVIALVAIRAQVGGRRPRAFLTKIAIDKYLAKSPTPTPGSATASAARLSSASANRRPVYRPSDLHVHAGIHPDLHHAVDRAEGDVRSAKQIFRHLQHMHVGFFDKNPVGRLVTRVTTDVDALNEMFTAGVVSIFEMCLFWPAFGIMMSMNWRLALITFAVLPLSSSPPKFSETKFATLTAGFAPPLRGSIPTWQEAVSGMLVLQLFQSREARL